MLKSFSLLAFSFVLISCGQTSSINRNNLDYQYINSSVGEPILLEKDDHTTSCPSLLTGDLNQEITVRLFNNWFNNEQSYVLPAKSKSGVVTNELFASVNFSGNIKFLKSKLKTKQGLFVEKEPDEFKVCPGFDYTKNHTYSSATASAMYSFNNVKESLEEAGFFFDPIRIKVAPIFTYTQEYYKKGKVVHDQKTLVNNAFYLPSSSEVVFLPQAKNKEGKIPFSEVPLWEIPFVGAHEYGHHIFKSIMKNYFFDRNKLNINMPSLCFNNQEDIIKEDNSIEGMPRTVTLNDVMDSLNEGISDLFARVVTPEKYKLESIGCFEFTRDVEFPRFANTQLKRLDRKVLNRFFANKRIKTINCYKEQDFQDPHIIGAIIAHGMHKFYESAQLSKKQRIQMIVEWLKLSNKDYLEIKTKDLEQVLGQLIRNGVQVVQDKYNLPKPQLCSLITQSFPLILTDFSCL